MTMKSSPLPKWHTRHNSQSGRSRTALILLTVIVLFWYFFVPATYCWPYQRRKNFNFGIPSESAPRHQQVQHFQECSISRILATNLTFMAKARPLKLQDFLERRDRLAQVLADEGIDAFIVEPGYTFSFYGNVTQTDWEPWEPEERPFLMVIQAQRDQSDDGSAIITAKTTFLVLSFEEARARLLGMPFESDISTVTYEEHWNPYETLMRSGLFNYNGSLPTLMVDEEIRDFISRGLTKSGFQVVGLGGKVEQVRQRKTQAEIEILRAVNTGTVEALRAMRKCMTPGFTVADVTTVLDNTLRAAGLEPFFDIVLFDENASNPHGGTNGTKRLANETMVLIDVGAHLYGKMHVWDVVFDAQTASLSAMHENSTAAAVDLAARKVIGDAGYGAAFTHQVGHGIGIKAHESPYLHKGNVNTTLKAGMTFTSEPGVYLVDKFGIRHEDILLVRADRPPELLTGERAKGPWNP